MGAPMAIMDDAPHAPGADAIDVALATMDECSALRTALAEAVAALRLVCDTGDAAARTVDHVRVRDLVLVGAGAFAAYRSATIAAGHRILGSAAVAEMVAAAPTHREEPRPC